MKWNTQYNPHKVKQEVNKSPSIIHPNEAMSIREILVRYSRGLPIDSRVPIYDEENDLQSLDPRKVDLADIQEAKEKYAEELNEIKHKQKEQEETKKRNEEQKQRKQQEMQQQFEQFLEAQKQKQ